MYKKCKNEIKTFGKYYCNKEGYSSKGEFVLECYSGGDNVQYPFF